MGKREISLLGCYFGLNSESGTQSLVAWEHIPRRCVVTRITQVLFGTVRGVFAAKNLPIGEVVVSVPDAEVIMSHTCRYAGMQRHSLSTYSLCRVVTIF